MKSKDILYAPTLENAEMHVKGNGLLRLLSFIVSYLVWQLILLVMLFLVLFDIIQIHWVGGALRKLLLACSIFGIAPLLFVFLTWRLVEKLGATYMTSYIAKHLTRENNLPPNHALHSDGIRRR